MLKIYNTNMETNKLEEIKEFRKGSWINLVNPSENEIKRVCESINIQEDFIRDALDYEEKARIDTEEDDNTILFVIDVTVIEKSEDNDIYSTMPLGIIVVRDDFFITVSLRKNKVIEDFEIQDKKEEIKRWYDGYKIGEVEGIYNPWSILNYLTDRKLMPYWVNTSSNDLIKLILKNSETVKEKIERLLKDEAIEVKINLETVIVGIEKNEDNIWGLML